MIRVLTTGALLVLFAQASQAVVLNGDFSNGLADWTTEGSVTTTVSQEARLGDDDPFYGILFQGVPLDSGRHTLSFDFDGSQLSSTVPGGAFPDAFFASLYFIDDLPSFSLDPFDPVFDDVIALFDLDHSGVTCFGSPGPCAGRVTDIGNSWLNYSVGFTNAFQHVIPVFELYDGNFIVDSALLLDNVEIAAAAVPVPGTLLLVGGMLMMTRRGRAGRPASS